MNLPLSVSELLVLKNLAEVLGFKTLDEAEIKVESWFKNVDGKSVDFNELIKQASKAGLYEMPKGSLLRLIDFVKTQPEYQELMYRDLNLNISMALGVPIQQCRSALFGDLTDSYSRIESAVSPDFLLKLTYLGNQGQSGRNEQQVTVSMQELEIEPKPYWMQWGRWSGVLAQAKESTDDLWPSQYAELIEVLTNEVDNEFVKSNPPLLGLLDPNGQEHVLVAFGDEPGCLHIAKKVGSDVVSYTESFDAFEPVRVRPNPTGLSEEIIGLETRLALEIPAEIEERAPYLYFEMERNGERIKIESSDLMSFDLALFDENRQQPVSSHFYYGIETEAANAIWQLNRYVALRAKVQLDDGCSTQEIRSNAIDYLYETLKSKHGCQCILTPKPEIDLEDEGAPPAP